MKEAVLAATMTLLIAFGLAGGLSQASAATSPEAMRPIIIPRQIEVVLPEPVYPVESFQKPEPVVLAYAVESESSSEDEIETAPVPVPSTVSTTTPPAPEPEPEPTPPADTGMGSDVEQWRSTVSTHFGDLGDGTVNTVLCLMSFESGGNPGATNPSSGAAGLMQVLPGWADDFNVTVDALYDPNVNLSISRALYNDGGFGHWSPYNRGNCR